MIGIGSLTVHLGGTRVVDDVGLTLVPGEWTTLIGRNGAGKTTMLRAVAGMVPYAGSIAVDGRQVREMTPRERARVAALVPQSPLLPADMTVREYVMLGRTPYLGFLGRPGRRYDSAVQQAIDSLGLAAFTQRRLDAISGGERQRAVLARALAQQAPVLLLDEPTTALDVGRQQEVLDLVWALRAERSLTVLGAMHDLTLPASTRTVSSWWTADGSWPTAHRPMCSPRSGSTATMTRTCASPGWMDCRSYSQPGVRPPGSKLSTSTRQRRDQRPHQASADPATTSRAAAPVTEMKKVRHV